MSTVIDVSSVLGEYMLKGWILGNDICKKCSKVPLMRSRSTPPREFCANCDGGPVNPSTPIALSQTSTSSVDSTSQIASRPSTPPTEASSSLSSPTFAPPLDIEEITRRRQQSDLASSEIGKRLLKGWAMLADECPNTDCYGIPLVRPPRTNGEQTSRKECVVCHTVYVDRSDGNGLERLSVSQTSASLTQEVNQSRTSVTDTPLSPGVAATGRAAPLERSSIAPSVRALPASNARSTTITTTMRTLQMTIETLEQSLQRLTERLDLVSRPQAFDVNMIGQTADTIAKVSQALIKAKELQWSERQASES